jgi:hypothetical protein
MNQALIVAHEDVFKAVGGGVQVCHYDYELALRCAGYQLTRLPYRQQLGIIERGLSRITTIPARPRGHPELSAALEALIQSDRIKTIFYGLDIYPKVAAGVRMHFPGVTQVLLSHGVEAVDVAIAYRISNRSAQNLVRKFCLGRELALEMARRAEIDAVLTLSPFEVELEGWLGTPKALWVPRAIRSIALPLSPMDRRIGTVSTLNHPPNLAGIYQILTRLSEIPGNVISFRLVGGPEHLGNALRAEFPALEYLGPLGDEALTNEMMTWACFVHPLFVNSKGCSTKLALPLSLGLPIATTVYGIRGYVWDETIVPVARDVKQLLADINVRASLANFEYWRHQTTELASTMPTFRQIGKRIRDFLVNDR